jgi:hypothetical protein
VKPQRITVEIGAYDAREWLHQIDPITFDEVTLGLGDAWVMEDDEVLAEVERLYPGGLAAFEAEA